MPTSAGPRKKAASRSGNPATRSAASAPTEASPVGSFKKGARGELVSLPSGNDVRIIRIGLPTLIAEGLLADSLAKIASDHIEQSKGTTKADQERARDTALAEMMKDPAALKKLMEAFDKVVVRSWADPKVHPDEWTMRDAQQGLVDVTMVGERIPEEERDDNVLYVSEIDFEDRSFTFQYVSGGDPDLESFREATGSGLAGVPSST